ncbi:MAG: hypothetical protein VKJ24_11075 [Synechococcales bacterium]|nr:hypothetical protein [Synechococcales bacterium]
MNAAEQATNLTTASKIATIVNLFQASFPDAQADLKPWRNDPDTRNHTDPDSIDIGFHFPGWSRRYQSRSILLQIRLYDEREEEPGSQAKRAIGVELAGFTHTGQQWRLSTVEQWRCSGVATPVEEAQEKLRAFCRELLQVFNSGNF